MHPFIAAHREDDPRQLALLLANRHEPDAPYLLRQIEGWQRLRHKVPAWAAVDELEYPPRLSLEQCSGEEAARYKAALAARLPVAGGSMADLTGGLGVDFSFMAPHFGRAVYVERQEELCRLARHNFPLLGLPRAEVVCAEAGHYLQGMAPVDLLFLDPARRDGQGRKTVRLADCTPDLAALLPQLLLKSRVIVAKLSPMLDLHSAVADLGGHVAEAHIVAAAGECKELLLVLRAGVGGLRVVVADGPARFAFTPDEEAAAAPLYAAAPDAYLFEPGPALMKAGAFRLVAERFGLRKLHPNSHLYTAAAPVEGFPGRTFAVEGLYGFAKRDVAALRALGPRANLAVRNFPATTDELRRRLKVKDGGDRYWFATTLADGRHAVITARRHAPAAG